jgi:hypothetical protein
MFLRMYGFLWTTRCYIQEDNYFYYYHTLIMLLNKEV